MIKINRWPKNPVEAAIKHRKVVAWLDEMCKILECQRHDQIEQKLEELCKINKKQRREKKKLLRIIKWNRRRKMWKKIPKWFWWLTAAIVFSMFDFGGWACIFIIIAIIAAIVQYKDDVKKWIGK